MSFFRWAATARRCGALSTNRAQVTRAGRSSGWSTTIRYPSHTLSLYLSLSPSETRSNQYWGQQKIYCLDLIKPVVHGGYLFWLEKRSGYVRSTLPNWLKTTRPCHWNEWLQLVKYFYNFIIFITERGWGGGRWQGLWFSDSYIAPEGGRPGGLVELEINYLEMTKPYHGQVWVEWRGYGDSFLYSNPYKLISFSGLLLTQQL